MKIAAGLVVTLAAATPASADYVGSVVGLDGDTQSSSLTINAGDSFSGAVLLDGSAGTRADFALFRLVFSVSNLEYDTGWYDWSTPFTTGGTDDYSSPSLNSSGTIDVDTFSDPFHSGDIDVAFENVSDSFGEYFTTGTILTFTLTIPETFDLGSFTIDFSSDTFTDGASIVNATTGSGLLVNVVPAPTTAALAGIAGLVATRRRR